MFNECIARQSSARHFVPYWKYNALARSDATWVSVEMVGLSYLPAPYAQQEAQYVRLLLLVQLFDVLESAHLKSN
jgi:hypothetical protein